MKIEKKQEGKATSERSYSMFIERPKMNRSQKALICLWLLCLLLVGGALFSTPYMRDAPIFGVNGQEGLFESFSVFSIIAIPCSWPLYFALQWSEKPNGSTRQVAFGIASGVIAALFFRSIAFGHDFSIGLNMIFCVLTIWAIYPVFSPPKH